MSTAPFILESVTVDVLKHMALAETFLPQTDETVRVIKPQHVILRDTTDDRPEDQGRGEKNILKPALIVTYLGTELPVGAGETECDDGRHRLIVQLVDDVPPTNTNRRKTYHYWMNLIRKKLQLNPYRAEIDTAIADFWLVHVSLISKASPRDYRLHNQMKAGLEVLAIVREPRT